MIPTVLMLTVLHVGLAGLGKGTGVIFQPESESITAAVLHSGGWTLLTAVNAMLFSLVHNPCSTTLYTIWKETRSRQVDRHRSIVAAVYGTRALFCRGTDLEADSSG